MFVYPFQKNSRQIRFDLCIFQIIMNINIAAFMFFFLLFFFLFKYGFVLIVLMMSPGMLFI